MKFSVITPSFNSVKTLRRTIESVMQQKGVQYEHIIMDGGSTDGTVALLESYPHLVWRSERDKGQSDAMNKGFALSSGDIIIYLNADDELNAGWLQELERLFSRNPGVDMVVGNLLIEKMGKVELQTPSTKLADIFDYFRYRFPLNPACYAYRRQLQQQIGPFPLDNHYTMDYWFLLRAYSISKLLKSDYTGGTFYFDGNNKSSNGAVASASLKRVRSEFIRQHFFKKPVLRYIATKVKNRISS